jgi:hypothetical protein
MAVTGRKKPRRVMQAFGGARVIDVVGGALGWGVGPTHKRQGIPLRPRRNLENSDCRGMFLRHVLDEGQPRWWSRGQVKIYKCGS